MVEIMETIILDKIGVEGSREKENNTPFLTAV